jgi:hypothetical protein
VEGLQLSVPGFPARFCIARSALATVLTHTFGLGTDGITLILEGVDASSTLTGVQSAAWISMGSPGNKCYFGSKVYDPATDGEAMHFSWRGALPIYGSDGGCEVGVDCTVFADLALFAWGTWIPHDLAIAL